MAPKPRYEKQSLDERSAELSAFGQKLQREFVELRKVSRLLREESSVLREDARLLRKTGYIVGHLTEVFADFCPDESKPALSADHFG